MKAPSVAAQMRNEMDEILGAAWIVWVDYGYEGWAPNCFATEEEATRAILAGDFSGPTVITSGGKKLGVR